MMVFVPYFLPIYFLLYFSIAFVGKSIVVALKLGKSPLVLPKEDNAYGLVGRYFKLQIIVIFAYLTAFFCLPKEVFAYGEITLLNHPALAYFGLVLLVLAFGITIKAQADMKESWRIGIDVETPTLLVTSGLFKYSRNPIFLGMLMAMFGMCLLLPTLVSLFFFTISYMLINIQIRLEEAFLQKQHGEDYELYIRRTSRFFKIMRKNHD